MLRVLERNSDEIGMASATILALSINRRHLIFMLDW